MFSLNKDTLNQVTDFIKNVGFPIAIAFFLLWRLDTTIEKLTTALTHINNNMNYLSQLLYYHVQKEPKRYEGQ